MAFLENGKIVFLRHFVSFDEVDFTSWFESKRIQQILIASVIDIPSSFLTQLQEIAPLKIIINSDFNSHFQQGSYELESLGIDRKLLVLGALACFQQQDCLVISLGSCITYTIVSASKELKGGVISPGLDMRAKAMHQFTEKLPYLNWRDMRLDGSFGFQTDQNLYHGILTAVKYELSGFISDYLTKYPNGLIVFTGGDANVLFPFFSTDKIMLELNLLWYGMLQFSPLKNV